MEYYAEYQFDIQHQFARGVVVDVGYVGNRGVNIQLGRDINQIRLTGPNAGVRAESELCADQRLLVRWPLQLQRLARHCQ